MAAAAVDDALQHAVPFDGVREDDHGIQHMILDQLENGHLTVIRRCERKIEVCLGMENEKAIALLHGIFIQGTDALQAVFLRQHRETYADDAGCVCHRVDFLSVLQFVKKYQLSILQ